MKNLSEMTGGVIIMCDSAKNNVFKKSFSKYFSKDSKGFLKLGLSANLTVIPSRQIKI